MMRGPIRRARALPLQAPRQRSPQRIFDAVRTVINKSGVLAGKSRRVLDSTVLDDAVIRQDAIMQLVAQIRVRRVVPAAGRVVFERMTMTVVARNRRVCGTTRPISNGS